MAGRPFVYLLQDIGAHFSDLVDSETRLVRAEMAEKARHACVGSGLVVVAALVGVVALLMVAMAGATGLTRLGIDRGWSELIVAGIALLLAGALAAWGVSDIRSATTGPRRAINQFRRDLAAARESFR
jgi:hypothetical protein